MHTQSFIEVNILIDVRNISHIFPNEWHSFNYQLTTQPLKMREGINLWCTFGCPFTVQKFTLLKIYSLSHGLFHACADVKCELFSLESFVYAVLMPDIMFIVFVRLLSNLAVIGHAKFSHASALVYHPQKETTNFHS